MRLKTPFVVAQRHFTPDFCHRVIHRGEHSDQMAAKVRNDPKGDQRDSSVSWIKSSAETAWLFDPVIDFMKETNKAHWGWQITGIESLQYTRYGPGQHYEWHADQRPEPYPEDTRWAGQIRKLSMTISLCAGDSYEGGEFVIEELENPPFKKNVRIKSITGLQTLGTAVIFPSHLYHKVMPVTQGTRRSLVAWFLGPPFR